MQQSSHTPSKPTKRAKASASGNLKVGKTASENSGEAASPIVSTSSDVSLSLDSEQVRTAMARSRSSSRRSKIAYPLPPAATTPVPKTPVPKTPTSRSLNTAMFGSSGSEVESSPRKTGGRSATRSSLTSEVDYLLPQEAMIPGSTQRRGFTASEVAPWPVVLVNSWSLITMTPGDLADRLELPWGLFGPPDGNLDRPA